jgi:TerY-C metal binding domain
MAGIEAGPKLSTVSVPVNEVDPQERSFVCERCGQASASSARFCTKCGAPTGSPPNGSSASHNISATREAILVAGARCTATRKPFAIRFEQGARGIWQACAAFAISERQLSNPAFSSSEVSSSASVASSYRGCPHCGADTRKQFAGVSFVKCSCGKLACSTGTIGAENLCPWCERVGILVRHGSLQISGIRDQ